MFIPKVKRVESCTSFMMEHPRGRSNPPPKTTNFGQNSEVSLGQYVPWHLQGCHVFWAIFFLRPTRQWNFLSMVGLVRGILPQNAKMPISSGFGSLVTLPRLRKLLVIFVCFPPHCFGHLLLGIQTSIVLFHGNLATESC